MKCGNLSRRNLLLGGIAVLTVPAQGQPVAKRTAEALIVAARRQIGVTLRYDPAYVRLPFPGGDVDRAAGVCTDVLVRAYRDAFALDLQALVNADMRKAFASYPRRWGLSQPDANIDHRRVLNLEKYFERAGAKLVVPQSTSDWRPGDIVTAMIDNRLPHIGIVTDRKAGDRPLIIHNIGAGTREEDVLTQHHITGRYRWALDA